MRRDTSSHCPRLSLDTSRDGTISGQPLPVSHRPRRGGFLPRIQPKPPHPRSCDYPMDLLEQHCLELPFPSSPAAPAPGWGWTPWSARISLLASLPGCWWQDLCATVPGARCPPWGPSAAPQIFFSRRGAVFLHFFLELQHSFHPREATFLSRLLLRRRGKAGKRDRDVPPSSRLVGLSCPAPSRLFLAAPRREERSW